MSDNFGPGKADSMSNWRGFLAEIWEMPCRPATQLLGENHNWQCKKWNPWPWPKLSPVFLAIYTTFEPKGRLQTCCDNFVQHACVPAKINGPPTKTECWGNRSHKTKLFNLKQRWADHTLAFDATSEAENSMISFDVFGARNEETMATRVGSVLSKTFQIKVCHV